LPKIFLNLRIVQIGNNASLVFEGLSAPDTSSSNAMLIHVCVRNAEAKRTSQPVEVVFEGGPTPNV
jgi:hypothetical protein